VEEQLHHNRPKSGATVLSLLPLQMHRTLWMMVSVGALALLFGQPAKAQASLTLTFSTASGGITLGGSGSATATITFGAVQAFGGSVPTGVTKAVTGATSWSLSTPINVEVVKHNSTSASYTMTAQLKTADTKHTWNFGTATVTSTAPATVTTTGVYSSTTPYTVKLTTPFTTAAGAVNNTIDIVVTSN
jgi:hypothetical protein